MEVGLLHEELEPTEWKELHVGAERSGQLCAQAIVLDTYIANILGSVKKIGEVLGFRGSTAFVASLDVRTAFDVAKPSVVRTWWQHSWRR